MRGLRVVIAGFLLASSAAASYIQIISSFEGGHLYSRGVAYGVEYDGRNLWTMLSAGFLLKRQYPNGSVISSYLFSPQLHLPPGMAYDGCYLYTTDADPVNHVYKIDAANPTIVSSFPYPPGTNFCGGLAYNGTDLYFAALGYARVWVMNTEGSILSTFGIETRRPSGLAYDDQTPGGPFLWCCDEPKERITHIYKMTTTGSSLDSVEWPIENSHLVELAFDGTYLWGVETPEIWNENHIYRIYFYSDAAVKPASVGRIKALYR